MRGACEGMENDLSATLFPEQHGKPLLPLCSLCAFKPHDPWYMV